ncbi:decapping 5-like protein [Drosera capensis]
MAAGSSRSTSAAVSPSPDSYIGSLISLTSKSEIRYEGILFNVNTEESSIGLRNVRSFGTEGRRKDGLTVAPSDNVYEYIVFRGSDIRDLQVKASPPTQVPSSLHNDPAIIQSHYPPTLASSGSLRLTTVGPAQDLSTQTPLPGPSRPDLQGGLPLYQPGGSVGSWNSSTSSQSNGSGLAMPMYWQGYYGPLSNLQNQQQTFLRTPQGLSMPPSLQQPVPYPPMNPSVPTVPSSSPATDFPPPLVPPILGSSLNMQSTIIPVQSSQPCLDAFRYPMPNKAPSQLLSSISESSSLPMASVLAAAVDKVSGSSSLLDQAKQVSGSRMPHNSLSEPLPEAVATSAPPSLVTPGQFLQMGSTTLPPSQSSQITQKDDEVVQVSVPVSQTSPPSSAAANETPVSAVRDSQGPLLPLPHSNQKLNGMPSQYSSNLYPNRGGRGRGRGSELSRAATSFSEDFDFEAMNERFNKDEVWGHLGKSKANFDDVEDQSNEDDRPRVDIKPVYKKDDFFDTLSCNSIDNRPRNERPRYSERMRHDTETFGDYSRYRGGGYRGGRGQGRGGGQSQGGYYGRGNYGYVGRGRGGHNIYRAT